MHDLTYLLIYLGIAAAIGFVANRKGMGRFRAWLDRASNKHVAGLAEAKRISMVGETRAVQAFAGRAVHRVTIGTRLLSTGLAVALLLVINGRVGAGPGTFVPQGYEIPALIAAVLLAIYYLAFIWSYRLIVEDGSLTVPTLSFGRRRLDLRKLVRVEDDGAYLLRLYFEDGGRSDILKYVEGRIAFIELLEGYVASKSRWDSDLPMEFAARRGI